MKNIIVALLSFAGASAITLLFVEFQNDDEWVAPAKADELKNPFSGNKVTSANENLFSFNCERCHGSYGKGDGVDGRKLKPRPADLTSERVQKQSDGAIFWKLSTGKGEMDAFKNKLTENERWQLVNYIRKLGKL